MDGGPEICDQDRESLVHEISEKIHTVDGSSSSSSGGEPDEKKTAPPSYGKGKPWRYCWFQRETPVPRPSDEENRNFAVNLLKWKDDRSVVLIAVATAVWVLIELFECHLVTLVCHLTILAFAMTFFCSNSSIIINKKPPPIPEVSLPLEPFLEVATYLCNGINAAISYLRGIASVRDLKKFLKVTAVLWAISVVGSFCSFFMLFYLSFVFLYIVPCLYKKYADNIEELTEQAIPMIKKLHNMFHANAVRKISTWIKKEKQA